MTTNIAILRTSGVGLTMLMYKKRILTAVVNHRAWETGPMVCSASAGGHEPLTVKNARKKNDKSKNVTKR